jgi:hypothetical protein
LIGVLPAQWTRLDSFPTLLQMTSDYHGVRITNTDGPTPATGSQWRVYNTDDDWVNDRFQFVGGGGNYGCCYANAFDFHDDALGFVAVLFQGIPSIYRTTNAGETWAVMGANTNFLLYPVADLQAFSDTVAYAAGAHFQGSQSKCFRITPNGVSTVFVDSMQLGASSLVRFVTDNLGFVTNADSNGNYFLHRTSDGGQSWSQRLGVGIGTIEAIDFVGLDTGFVGGNAGIFYKSIDGGLTWNSYSVNGSTNVRALDFVNPLVGFAASDNGLILRTTDGGLNWANEVVDTSSDFHYIKAINANIAYAQATNGKLYKRNYIAGADEGSPLVHVRIVPNPTHGACEILLPENHVLRNWEVFGVEGQRLLQGNSPRLDLSGLPSGMYWLQGETKTGRFSSKIIKE